MQLPLYFAYGSNMSLARIERRLGKVKKISTYVLVGWRLVFNCGFWSTYANIEKGLDTDKVEGVLYELTPRQIYLLDQYEGVPNSYEKFYQIHNDKIIYAYISRDLKIAPEYPELEYLALCQAGAEENGLQDTYTRFENLKNEIIKLTLKRKQKKETSRTSVVRVPKKRKKT